VIPPTERGELEAFRSLLDGWDEARLAEVGGALCTAAPIAPSSALLSRVLGLGLEQPATQEVLDQIDRFFSEAGAAYGITVTPEADPPELTAWLAERGFSRGYAWAKFRRGVEPIAPPQTDLVVERVGADRGDVFADVFQRAYGTPELLRPRLEQLPGLPGWHCFVAFGAGVPAATGAVFVTGEVGWLGMAGTLPEFRRRGAQSSLLAARIDTARETGCNVVVTETGEAVEGRASNSYRNIVRAGFEPVYVRQNYLSSAEADTSGTRA
jgi:GNAT superfamily N-acetyltransferase